MARKNPKELNTSIDDMLMAGANRNAPARLGGFEQTEVSNKNDSPTPDENNQSDTYIEETKKVEENTEPNSSNHKAKPKNENTKSKTSQNRNKKRRTKSKLSFMSDEESEGVTRSIRLPAYLDQEIRDLTNDENGKKKKGSKGFIKTMITNGVIRELVELGVFDESELEKIDNRYYN